MVGRGQSNRQDLVSYPHPKITIWLMCALFSIEDKILWSINFVLIAVIMTVISSGGSFLQKVVDNLYLAKCLNISNPSGPAKGLAQGSFIIPPSLSVSTALA